jgi:uncharacterized repeat protein (TIGR01451 family)
MTLKLRRLAVISASLCALALAFAGSAFAANPSHVNFTLEGCRLPVGATLPSSIVCADSEYTTGNLGKSWNELDLVPYRITADSSGADQTYTMAVALDAEDSGKRGYDVISSPILNLAHSTSAAACQLVSVSGEKIMSPGMGGISKTRYRELTIHQAAGATCVYDYYGRLAIGSHLFPGSSLHANKGLITDPGDLTTGAITSSGIGASDVSIPVKEITAQALSKDMAATQGSAYSWTVNKANSAATVNFGNTCASTTAQRTATLTVTVSWERHAASPNGDITLVTHIFATNPAARMITVNVDDKIYSGSTQSTQLGSTVNSGDVDIPANRTNYPVLTYTRTVASGTATSFNDVATATYKDKLTNIDVVGTTQATASTNLQISNNPMSASAEIRDSESITGTGLTFSTGLPTGTVGSFTGYTPGTATTGPVQWSSGTVSGDGQAVFTKTVYLDQPRATTGTLSDTAGVYITGDVNASGTAQASTAISSTLACGTITIVKDALPNDAQDFSFSSSTLQPTTIGSFSLDDDADPALSNTATFNGLKAGSYSVTEASQKGWHLTGLSCDDGSTQSTANATANIAVPAGGTVTCTFQNTKVFTSIQIVKTGTPDVVHDGDNVTFTYAVSNPSSNNGSISDVVVTDDKCSNVQGPISKTGGNSDNLLDPGETWTYTCTTPALHSDEDANHVITNIATAAGKDQYGDPVSDQDDDTTKVIHPAIAIDKTGPATAQAGDKIAYVLTVTNPGDTPFAASTVIVTDAQCNGDPVTLLGKGGDATPASFDPGDVWTYTCSLQTAAGDQSVENHASAEATDQLGKVVASADVATAVLSQPQQVVLPARITPGAARLAGATGCQSRAFNARIRGSKIATVTFVLDGKVVKKVTNRKNASLIALRVQPSKLRLGVHRLVVNVTFQSSSGSKAKTFRLSFQRCAKKLVTPRFTG